MSEIDLSKLTQKQMFALIMEKQTSLENQCQELGNKSLDLARQHKELDYQHLEIEKQCENIKTMLVDMESGLSEQSQRIIWLEYMVRPILVLLFGFALLIAANSIGGCNVIPSPTPNPIPGPGPKPIDEIIYVNSETELKIIQSALRIVSREWSENRYSDLGEAVEAIDFLMGGNTDGVDQKVQERILVEFTGGRDFLESVKYVQDKLKVKGN